MNGRPPNERMKAFLHNAVIGPILLFLLAALVSICVMRLSARKQVPEPSTRGSSNDR
jgi:hypothetical protein